MSVSGGRRLFRTVLFTDIVGSTQLAAELGDRQWRRTVAAHHSAVRAELKRHRGREVDTAGDGFFAIFESPTDAVRCAAAAVAAVHALGLRIRAGVHTGEVEQSGAKYGGISVHIGARLLSLAGPGEVIVSSTVRELVAGSGHAFDDRGVHELKGVPGEWHVYSLALPRFEEGVPLVGVDDEQLRALATRKQRLMVGSLLAVIILLAVSLVGAFLILNRPVPPVRGPNTVALYGSAGEATDPLSSYGVDRGPSDIALGEGSLWTANIDAGTVSRIDSSSGEVSSFGQAGSRPTVIVTAPGRIWIADRYSSRLTALDAVSGNVVGSFPIHASALAAADGQLWLTDDIAERLVRLDPASGTVLAEIELGRLSGASDLALANNSIWVTGPRAAGLLRVDPQTGAVSDVAAGVAELESMAVLGDDLWVASPSQDTVARIDVTTGRVALTAQVCDSPVGLAPTPSGTWVVCARGEERLWRVDRSGLVEARIAVDGVPSGAVAEGERVWVALRVD